VITGVFNSWVIVGSLTGLVSTAYGRLLLFKIALFFAMLSLAAVNPPSIGFG
jgi:putative copper resistance protein D